MKSVHFALALLLATSSLASSAMAGHKMREARAKYHERRADRMIGRESKARDAGNFKKADRLSRKAEKQNSKAEHLRGNESSARHNGGGRASKALAADHGSGMTGGGKAPVGGGMTGGGMIPTGGGKVCANGGGSC